ncbi:MAG: MFS transporter [Candidatus Sericytochromatia bacterium]|nr:MFS transporter [Candidatus Sericytochromatia bacterium]
MTRHQRTIMIGLMTGMVLNVFEMSVVGTAMPSVVAAMGGLALYNWVFTAFMLTSTVTLPIFGKLGDQFGRKWVYCGGLVAFLAGSIACGLSPSMAWLIASRALQGLGAGAMFPSTMAIVGEIFSPAERGRASAYFGPVFLVGGLLGPVIGGFIVDGLGWRWVFYACVPFGLAAMVIMLSALESKPRQPGPLHLDIAGAVLLITATTPILLATRALDNGLSWQSPQVLGLFALTLLAGAAFVWQENRAVAPIMPMSLMRLPIFAVSAVTEFLESGVLISVTMMLPLLAQGVIGLSPSATGLLMTPFMVLIILANMGTGQAISRLGRYRSLAIAGFVIQSIGLLALALLPPGGTLAHISAGVLAAVGLGMLIPIYTICVQNAVPKAQIGTATAGMQFFSQLGESIGVTLIGMAFSTALLKALPASLRLAGITPDSVADLFRPEALAKMAPTSVVQLRQALAVAFTQVYWIWALMAIAALVITVTLLADMPLRRDEPVFDETDELPVPGT